MKPDIDKALAEATAAIYFDDPDLYRTALMRVIRHLNEIVYQQTVVNTREAYLECALVLIRRETK